MTPTVPTCKRVGMKRIALALIAFVAVATSCTPEQLDRLGVTDPGAREVLLALEDKPIVNSDGSIIQLDGSFTPAPTYEQVGNRCPQWEHLLHTHAPAGGWDVDRMSRTMWRESRCFAHVYSKTSDSGLLQINRVNYSFLRARLGEWVDRWTLTDPTQNVRAAAALCEWSRKAGYSCYRPWGGKG